MPNTHTYLWGHIRTKEMSTFDEIQFLSVVQHQTPRTLYTSKITNGRCDAATHEGHKKKPNAADAHNFVCLLRATAYRLHVIEWLFAQSKKPSS